MTTAVTGAPAAREWWARPRIVFPVVGALVALVALLTPESDAGRLGDARLSAHLAGSLGARALAETAERFGWRVERNDDLPVPSHAPGETIHAVLAPSIPLTDAEAHAYLEAVRGGDALLLVVEPRTALADSLGVRPTRAGGSLVTDDGDAEGCPRRELIPALWPDGQAHLYGLSWRRPPAGSVTFASVTMDARGAIARVMDAAVGFSYGRGRVVVVSDPDLLRNDMLRYCRWGADVITMRMLEWLRAGGDQPRGTLAFDEFHQGFGSHSSATRTIRRFLLTHPVGRAMLGVIAAALVLLLALAPRPLPPRPRDRVERRNPLEQVEALALAYEQVRATRTVTARLLRGMRLRVEHSLPSARSRSDDAFLDDVERGDPALAADAAVVRAALRDGRPNDELPAIGEALRRIEASLTTSSLA